MSEYQALRRVTNSWSLLKEDLEDISSNTIEFKDPGTRAKAGGHLRNILNLNNLLIIYFLLDCLYELKDVSLGHLLATTAGILC